ncbi:MAG: hypoxanthine-guanine phosphoribosyltransferase [Gammaproteobacteria bacterium]
MTQPPAEILSVMENASCLYEAAEIEAALARLAAQINIDLRDKNPIFLPIMNGGLATTASLLRRLDFPLQLDYVHLTRYRDTTSGGNIKWIYHPHIELKDRHVVLVDDLLDHGITLREAVNYCRRRGAISVYTVVLIVKLLDDRPGLQSVDYYALQAPDRYLFGYGMDYKSYWRNAPGIFAV